VLTPVWVYRGHVPENALDINMPLPRRKRAVTSDTFPLLTRAKSITAARPRRISLSTIPTFCTTVLTLCSIENLRDYLAIFPLKGQCLSSKAGKTPLFHPIPYHTCEGGIESRRTIHYVKE
jgi:hypothetical protein